MASNARPNKPSKYHQGYYKLQNPEKYVGNPNEIIFRSSYEKRFCFYCDLNPKVLKWGSEIITIPYVDPYGKTRRYHLDFYVELPGTNKRGPNKRLLIEIKPQKETHPPQRPNNLTVKVIENYKYALESYQKNLSKWMAAKQYAKDHGLEFIIVTEKHLNMIK